MSYISYDPRAAEKSVLSRPVEQPRTLADALLAWLNPVATSPARSTVRPAQRMAIAARLEKHL